MDRVSAAPARKLRRLDLPPRHDHADSDIPADILHLAELLQVSSEFILRNPRSYTPPTFGPAIGAEGHLDPGKFCE